MSDIKLPRLPNVQVPRIDADVSLIDIRGLAKWCQRVATEYARAAVEADRAQQYEGDDTARIEAIEKGIELVRKVNPDSWAARPVFGKWTRDHKTAREAIDAARAQRAAAQEDA